MLNKKFFSKKFLIIFLIIAVIIFLIIFFSFKKEKKQDYHVEDTVFNSSDSSLSLTLPGEFKFEEKKDDNFLLAVESPSTEAGVYISSIPASSIRDVSKFIEDEKDDFISHFNNTSNVSNISQLTIQGFSSSNYHFNYGDNGYVDVYWILKDSIYYVIDFRVNKELNDFSTHINDVLTSLKFN